MSGFRIVGVEAATPKHWGLLITVLPALAGGAEEYNVQMLDVHPDLKEPNAFYAYLNVRGPSTNYQYGYVGDQMHGRKRGTTTPPTPL